VALCLCVRYEIMDNYCGKAFSHKDTKGTKKDNFSVCLCVGYEIMDNYCGKAFSHKDTKKDNPVPSSLWLCAFVWDIMSGIRC